MSIQTFFFFFWEQKVSDVYSNLFTNLFSYVAPFLKFQVKLKFAKLRFDLS